MVFTWGLYLVVFLIPIIAVIFAVVGDDLDKENFLGPNALKVILCLTPVLFLFLPKTAPGLSEIDGYPQLVVICSCSYIEACSPDILFNVVCLFFDAFCPSDFDLHILQWLLKQQNLFG